MGKVRGNRGYSNTDQSNLGNQLLLVINSFVHLILHDVWSLRTSMHVIYEQLWHLRKAIVYIAPKVLLYDIATV